MNNQDFLKNLKNLTPINKNKSKVLGKGISALINTNQDNSNNNDIQSDKFKIYDIEIDKIITGKYQARRFFNEELLKELSNSIKLKGILQPILVKNVDNQNNFELIAGERRVRACKIAGLRTVPAIIVDFNNKEALEVGLIENLQRENLNPMEEAQAFSKLIQEYNYTHNDLAIILGKSRSYVTNYLRILTLPKEIQDLIAAKKLNVGHAKIIVNYECPMELVEEIVTKKLSVREVEKLIRGKKVSKNNSNNIDDDLNNQIKNKLNNIFNDCKIEVKTNKLGAGYIKISFINKENLKNILNNELKYNI